MLLKLNVVVVAGRFAVWADESSIRLQSAVFFFLRAHLLNSNTYEHPHFCSINAAELSLRGRPAHCRRPFFCRSHGKDNKHGVYLASMVIFLTIFCSSTRNARRILIRERKKEGRCDTRVAAPALSSCPCQPPHAHKRPPPQNSLCQRSSNGPATHSQPYAVSPSVGVLSACGVKLLRRLLRLTGPARRRR